MKAARSLTLACLLAAMLTTPAAAQDAECHLWVSLDPSLMNLGVLRLVSSDRLQDLLLKADPELLNKAQDVPATPDFSIDLDIPSPGSSFVLPGPNATPSGSLWSLRVSVAADAPDAQELADDLLVRSIRLIKEQLQKVADIRHQELTMHLHLATRQAAKSTEQLAQLQQQMATMQQQTGVEQLSLQTLQAGTQELQQHRRALDLEIRGMHAQQAAMKRQLDEVITEVQEGGDPVADELKIAVQNRQQILERMEKLVESGQAPSAEANQFREELARAKAELLRRREEYIRTHGGEQIKDLRRQLAESSVQLAAAEVQLQQVTEQLEKARSESTIHQASRVDLLSAQLPLIRESYMDAERQRMHIERELEGYLGVVITPVNCPDIEEPAAQENQAK